MRIDPWNADDAPRVPESQSTSLAVQPLCVPQGEPLIDGFQTLDDLVDSLLHPLHDPQQQRDDDHQQDGVEHDLRRSQEEMHRAFRSRHGSTTEANRAHGGKVYDGIARAKRDR
jgi:hypothetical protein